SDIRSGKSGDVPAHLKDSHYQGAQKMGRGIDYKYTYNYEIGSVNQQYLPDTIKNKNYYKQKDSSKFEQQLKQVHEKIPAEKNKNNYKPKDSGKYEQQLKQVHEKIQAEKNNTRL